MKKLIYVLVVCFAIFAVGFSQTQKQSEVKAKVSTVKSEKQQKKVVMAMVVYTCPMHPEVLKDKPGKCPKCGMNLVKKEIEKKVESKKK